jgi:hypothetical protein
MTQLFIVKNTSALITDVQIQAFIPDWKIQLNDHLRGFWRNLPMYDIQIGEPGSVQGAWNVFFQDGLEIKTDLGYHDVESGLPVIRIDAQAAKQYGYEVSEVGSHELCEAAVDPNETSFATGPWGTLLAETCDPFIMPWMPYKINNTTVANFVTPKYYGMGDSSRLDMKGMLTMDQVYPYAPPGAYFTIMPPGTTQWKVVFSPEGIPDEHMDMVNARVSGSLRVKELVTSTAA